jgi:hypothetical protein
VRCGLPSSGPDCVLFERAQVEDTIRTGAVQGGFLGLEAATDDHVHHFLRLWVPARRGARSWRCHPGVGAPQDITATLTAFHRPQFSRPVPGKQSDEPSTWPLTA